MTEKTLIGPGNSSVTSMKPFRLVKYFSYSGLIVFMLFTLVLSWIISNHAKKVLLERSEAYAIVVAENLSHQVFQQFVLPTVLRYGKIALRNPEQFKRLDTIVRDSTHGIGVQAVTIYDSKENVVSYSTIASRIGRTGVGHEEYDKALSGKSNSVVETVGSLVNLFPGADPIFAQLRTFIPFRQQKPFNQNPEMVMGVIEVEQELSEDLKAIIKLQGTIILISVLIMGALFTVLSFIVVRAERIIEERAQERRKLQEELNQSQRLATLGKMVASVSHEIKNPLGIVRSTADILGKRLKTVAPGNEHLANIIVEETSRLDGIVREFLDFARPQEPNLASANVNEVLSKVLTFMEPEFEKRNVGLVRKLADNLEEIEVDQDLIYRACLNILLNGVQAMPNGGTLRVITSWQRRPAGVVVEVTDSGSGMSAEKQQNIFTPFYTDKNRGTGLGLSIVKNIIESHRGTIAVLSAEGEGTTFTVTLPKRQRISFEKLK